MFAIFLAFAAAQPQPVKPVIHAAPLAPSVAAIPLITRKQRMIADARTLLARAEQVRSSYRPAAGKPSRAELDSTIAQVKSDLDSMSEMGEMESLRLQMAMDRLSKMMSTLSNIMKNISETDQGIVQNMK